MVVVETITIQKIYKVPDINLSYSKDEQFRIFEAIEKIKNREVEPISDNIIDAEYKVKVTKERG